MTRRTLDIIFCVWWRATYLRVRSSLLMRVNTIRQSAWLA